MLCSCFGRRQRARVEPDSQAQSSPSPLPAAAASSLRQCLGPALRPLYTYLFAMAALVTLLLALLAAAAAVLDPGEHPQGGAALFLHGQTMGVSSGGRCAYMRTEG